LHNNFIVANYAANGGCYDNDDGSSWYLEQNNFCVYGGMKSNFEGHNKRSSNNVHAFASVYGDTCLNGINQISDHYAEGYWNNTCILSKAGDKYLGLNQIDAKLAPKAVKKEDLHTYLGGNTVYAPNASAGVSWGGHTQGTIDAKKWLGYGLDQGTSIRDAAGITSAQIVELGLEVLKAPDGPPTPPWAADMTAA
jgi:hypothetical protein